MFTGALERVKTDIMLENQIEILENFLKVDVTQYLDTIRHSQTISQIEKENALNTLQTINDFNSSLTVELKKKDLHPQLRDFLMVQSDAIKKVIINTIDNANKKGILNKIGRKQDDIANFNALINIKENQDKMEKEIKNSYPQLGLIFWNSGSFREQYDAKIFNRQSKQLGDNSNEYSTLLIQLATILSKDIGDTLYISSNIKRSYITQNELNGLQYSGFRADITKYDLEAMKRVVDAISKYKEIYGNSDDKIDQTLKDKNFIIQPVGYETKTGKKLDSILNPSYADILKKIKDTNKLRGLRNLIINGSSQEIRDLFSLLPDEKLTLKESKLKKNQPQPYGYNFSGQALKARV